MIDLSTVKSISIPEGNVIEIRRNGRQVWDGNPYDKIEKLTSDGSQYLFIEDYTPQIGDAISVSYVRTRDINYEALFSAGTGNYQLVVLFSVDNNVSFFYKYFTTGSATEVRASDLMAGTNKIQIIIDGNGNLTAGKVSTSEQISLTKSDVNTPLYLFIRANLSSGFAGSIFGFCVTRNDETIINLLPRIRRDDEKPGMLDTISGKFYTNKGTGEFTYE